MTLTSAGKITPSNSKITFQVYQLQKNGTWLFIGLVTRKSFNHLLAGHIRQADICIESSKQRTYNNE